jgi:hypothetical protein
VISRWPLILGTRGWIAIEFKDDVEYKDLIALGSFSNVRNVREKSFILKRTDPVSESAIRGARGIQRFVNFAGNSSQKAFSPLKW